MVPSLQRDNLPETWGDVLPVSAEVASDGDNEEFDEDDAAIVAIFDHKVANMWKVQFDKKVEQAAAHADLQQFQYRVQVSIFGTSSRRRKFQLSSSFEFFLFRAEGIGESRRIVCFVYKINMDDGSNFWRFFFKVYIKPFFNKYSFVC